MGFSNSVGLYPLETHIWLAGAEIPKDIHSPLRNTQHRFTVSQVCWILVNEGHKWWLLKDQLIAQYNWGFGFTHRIRYSAGSITIITA